VIERPLAVVGRGRPPVVAVPAGWTSIELSQLPAEPFEQRGRQMVATVTVSDQKSATAALLAAARGVALVVTVTLAGEEGDRFLDDLARVAKVRPTLTPAVQLGAEHVALLDALVEGLTVTEAGERLGWSRRTATRRLAEARERLGAFTTAEALRRHQSR
jgi:hypothetical protein